MSNQSRLVLVQAYRLSPRVKNAYTHALTHLGSPLTNSETTPGTTTVLFIQQLELNEQQSGVVSGRQVATTKQLSDGNQEVKVLLRSYWLVICGLVLQQGALITYYS